MSVSPVSRYMPGISAFVIAILSTSAFGAVSSASLDWSSYNAFAIGIPGLPTPTLTFDSKITNVNASATNPDESGTETRSIANWDTARQVGATTNNASATAVGSGSQLSTFTSASGTIDPNNPFTNQASATGNSSRTANFSLDGAGVVVFTVPYSMTVTPNISDINNQSSSRVDGSASFSSFTGSPVNGGQSFDLESFFGVSSQNGTLVFGIVAPGAGSGSVTFSASSSASTLFSSSSSSTFAATTVPEPAAGIQLFIGIAAIGVLGMRRYRSV